MRILIKRKEKKDITDETEEKKVNTDPQNPAGVLLDPRIHLITIHSEINIGVW